MSIVFNSNKINIKNIYNTNKMKNIAWGIGDIMQFVYTLMSLIKGFELKNHDQVIVKSKKKKNKTQLNIKLN